MNNLIIVKSHKNQGIAILLVFLFGPLGMFYATIRGALIMLFLVPLVTLTLLVLFLYGVHNAKESGEVFIFNLFSGLSILTLLFIFFGYWVTCLIWACRSINRYNEEIDNELISNFNKLDNINSESKYPDNRNILNQLDQLHNLKEKGFINDLEFDLKAKELKNELLYVKKEKELKSDFKPQTAKINYKPLYLTLLMLCIVISFYYVLSKKAYKTKIENDNKVIVEKSSSKKFSYNSELKEKLLNTMISDIDFQVGEKTKFINPNSTTVRELLKFISPKSDLKCGFEKNDNGSITIIFDDFDIDYVFEYSNNTDSFKGLRRIYGD